MAHLNADDVLIIKNFCQRVIDKPRSISMQPHQRQGDFIWCEDWQIIEILKYFFNGSEMYMLDPPPNRLKNNPLFDKQLIAIQAEELWEECHGSVSDFVLHLQSKREMDYAGTSRVTGN